MNYLTFSQPVMLGFEHCDLECLNVLDFLADHLWWY